MTAPARRWSVLRRVCCWCGGHVGEDQGQGGVLHVDLGVLAHAGECSRQVHALRRAYDRSQGGRWRPRYEVYRLLDEHCAEPLP